VSAARLAAVAPRAPAAGGERIDPSGPGALEGEGERSQVDELLDELVPPDLDWRRVVRRYPIPSLLVAGAAGYWLGRSRRGVAVAEALAGALALGVTRELVDSGLDDVLD
jgi:hypothetical protein